MNYSNQRITLFATCTTICLLILMLSPSFKRKLKNILRVELHLPKSRSAQDNSLRSGQPTPFRATVPVLSPVESGTCDTFSTEVMMSDELHPDETGVILDDDTIDLVIQLGIAAELRAELQEAEADETTRQAALARVDAVEQYLRQQLENWLTFDESVADFAGRLSEHLNTSDPQEYAARRAEVLQSLERIAKQPTPAQAGMSA